MHKTESVLENKMHKILRDFNIQTIPARRSDRVLTRRHLEHLVAFAVPESENERKWKDPNRSVNPSQKARPRVNPQENFWNI